MLTGLPHDHEVRLALLERGLQGLRQIGELCDRCHNIVWICSFALDQNADIGPQLGQGLEECPFALALKQANAVILLIDENVEPHRALVVRLRIVPRVEDLEVPNSVGLRFD